MEVFIIKLNGNNKLIKWILRFTPTQIVVLGFALVIFIGSVLLNLPIASKNGQSIGYINSLFTATSATCVTGLVVVDTYRHWTIFGQIVILILIQIGGLGFMSVATLFSLLLGKRISLRQRLVMVESLNQYSLEGIVRLTKQILLGTLMFEGAGTLILSVKFATEFGIAKGIYKGIFHSISAFCNAGFDLMGENQEFSSLTNYANDTVVSLTIIALIVIGGLGFSVWDDIHKTRKFNQYRLHTKFVLVLTAVLIVFGFIFFFCVEYNNPNTLGQFGLKGKVLGALFQSVTPRTAGFNTINMQGLTNASKFITMILMFIGGSPGSTAGGIKTVTAGVLLFTVISVIKGKEDTELFEKRLNRSIVLKALSVVIISLGIVLITSLVLLISEGGPFLDILFECISAFGTVGLSLGITSSLSNLSKIMLIFTMFFGRVGVLTTVLALTIKLNKSNAKYKYPEDKVMVG